MEGQEKRISREGRAKRLQVPTSSVSVWTLPGRQGRSTVLLVREGSRPSPRVSRVDVRPVGPSLLRSSTSAVLLTHRRRVFVPPHDPRRDESLDTATYVSTRLSVGRNSCPSVGYKEGVTHDLSLVHDLRHTP